MQRYISSAAALLLIAGCGGEPMPVPEAGTGGAARVVKGESASQSTSSSVPGAPGAGTTPPSAAPVAPVSVGLTEEQVFSNLAQTQREILGLLKNIRDEETARQNKDALGQLAAKSEQSWRSFWAYGLVKKASAGIFDVNNEAFSQADSDFRIAIQEMRRISRTSALPVIKQDLVRIVRMAFDTKPEGSWSERDEKRVQGHLKAAGLTE